jgi:hypothetical protein
MLGDCVKRQKVTSGFTNLLLGWTPRRNGWQNRELPGPASATRIGYFLTGPYSDDWVVLLQA